MAIAKLSDITAADVKAYHGYTRTDKDTQLGVIIPLVTDMIIQYCQNDFESKARSSESPVIEAYQDKFYVKHYPIDSSVDIVLTENSTALTEQEDYRVDYDTGEIKKISRTDIITVNNPDPIYWDTDPEAVVISYTGGEDLATAAQDVVMVHYELCGMFSQIKTKTFINFEGVQQAVAITSIPPELKKFLDRHKRIQV